MSIKIVTQSELEKTNIDLLINTIYVNFIDLSEFPELKHNKDEIKKLLMSPNVQLFLYIINKKIAGYMLGEIMKLNDGRTVFYITYIYTAPKFRGKGIASKLMKLIITITEKNNLDGVMLICDTEDTHVHEFYLKRGFMPDMTLRRYDRHDVLFRY